MGRQCITSNQSRGLKYPFSISCQAKSKSWVNSVSSGNRQNHYFYLEHGYIGTHDCIKLPNLFLLQLLLDTRKIFSITGQAGANRNVSKSIIERLIYLSRTESSITNLDAYLTPLQSSSAIDLSLLKLPSLLKETLKHLNYPKVVTDSLILLAIKKDEYWILDHVSQHGFELAMRKAVLMNQPLTLSRLSVCPYSPSTSLMHNLLMEATCLDHVEVLWVYREASFFDKTVIETSFILCKNAMPQLLNHQIFRPPIHLVELKLLQLLDQTPSTEGLYLLSRTDFSSSVLDLCLLISVQKGYDQWVWRLIKNSYHSEWIEVALIEATFQPLSQPIQNIIRMLEAYPQSLNWTSVIIPFQG
jgi:hypothetical protein